MGASFFKKVIMNIQFSNKFYKCTIRGRLGTLGLSPNAVKALQLTNKTYVKFGTNKDDPKDKNFYMQVCSDKDQFKINSCGNYYYINIKPLLDFYEIDYSKSIHCVINLENKSEKLYKVRML